MNLQADEGADGQADVVALGAGVPCLAAFDPAVLLDAAVLLLAAPRLLRVFQPGPLVHLEVVGDPVFRVTVCGLDPERLAPPETFQMNDRSLWPRWAVPGSVDGLADPG
jgi:hypothetical protein